MSSLYNLRPLMGDKPDAELVLAARQGVLWAKEALFSRHLKMVAGMAFRLLGRDGGDHRDVVQDTFLEAFASLDKLESPEAFRAWVGGITVRMVRRRLSRARWFRSRHVEHACAEFDEALARTAPPDISSELAVVYRFLETLPYASRMVFLLRRVEGLQLEEVAGAMSLSLATVKRHLVKVDQALAQLDQPRKVRSS